MSQVPLAQQAQDHRNANALERALRSDPELRRIAKSHRWFLSVIERIELEEREAS